MKKTSLGEATRLNPGMLKFVRIMKLTALCMLICCLQVSAAGFSQTKVSLKLEGINIKKALNVIERKSSYRFLYNQALFSENTTVDIKAVNEDVTSVLDKMLSNTALTYEVLDNYLVVFKYKGEEFLQQKVTGRVTDAAGNPIPGASIRIKGTSGGTSADNAGNFSITVPENALLIISSVGFEDMEVSVSGKTILNITLQGSKKLQDEIVVIGYGTASKRDLTGSITKISGKEVADKPNSNPVASLQGKVAGMYVVNNGTPGASPDIRIRGTVSIGQVAPLYVVDGIFNDNIDYLNPNDIESIEVLKDASSLAIFGVKGATGVIAITTKKAKAGTVSVNFNTTYGFKQLTDKIKMANASEFATLFAEERANNGVTEPFDYTGLSANTNWIDAVTRTANYGTSNLRISGSTEKNKFNLGVGYISDEGIIRHEKLEKWLMALNDELKVSKAVKVGVNLNISRQNNPYDATWVLDAARKVIPQVSSGTKRFLVKDPYSPDSLNTDIYSGLDVGLQSSGVVNPLLQLENEWNKTVNIEYRTVGSVYGEVNFAKNFNFRATLYGDMSTVDKRQYTPLYYAYNPKDDVPYLYSQNTSVREDINNYRKFQQDYILNYKKNFGDHGLTLTGGFTTYYFGNFNRATKVSQFTGPTALPIPNDKRFWYINNGFGDPTSASEISSGSNQSEYSTVSFLGRALYNYKSKYFLNASIRNDASSRLPEANRNQVFWALGAAWDMTREDFMRNQKIFDFLKLKTSIGVLGNQTASRLDGTPLNYPFYPNLLTGNNAVFGTNVYSAAEREYIPNPNLKWETVTAFEVGVEANAFQNRLHFEANYYDRTTNNLMTFVDRSQLGLKNELVNGGSLRNWGEEFAASWNQAINKDFSINIGGNITFLKNKVLSLSEELPTGFLSRSFMNNGSAESRTVPGMPIGSFYGYEVAGIYQSYADILASPVASSIGAYRPGDFKFKDLAGPGSKGPDGQITSDDRTFIGNPTPKFTYGGSINLTYKGFNLGLDFNGVYGNQIFRTWGSLESPFQRVNYSADKMGRWHGAGTSNWVPLVSQGDRFNYNGSTYNIEDGSYFRLRNIQLGYNFQRRLIEPLKIENLRVFANVQNLKTWKNSTGYTAEYGGDATAFGYDNAGGAIPMVTTFGLNVTF
ncbi:TonB-dependent receptor [Flavihumibacter profundi]|uniref:TonB-dependent receptor n=1 Tax=Flavihumibacter profundi TaxID=2716883 RepID=UPI001CC4BE91|nr:TonB-dependent receptor [Flavihumibacter profundi]MBZ5857804.1 TonB-dependent receptor [Flavihumibacter profundi]